MLRIKFLLKPLAVPKASYHSLVLQIGTMGPLQGNVPKSNGQQNPKGG